MPLIKRIKSIFNKKQKNESNNTKSNSYGKTINNYYYHTYNTHILPNGNSATPYLIESPSNQDLKTTGTTISSLTSSSPYNNNLVSLDKSSCGTHNKIQSNTFACPNSPTFEAQISEYKRLQSEKHKNTIRFIEPLPSQIIQQSQFLQPFPPHLLPQPQPQEKIQQEVQEDVKKTNQKKKIK